MYVYIIDIVDNVRMYIRCTLSDNFEASADSLQCFLLLFASVGKESWVTVLRAAQPGSRVQGPRGAL